MHTSPDHQRTVPTRPALLQLVAVCALVGGGSSLAGAVALAAALALVIVAGGFLARLVEHRLPGAAGTTVVVLGTVALAASLTFTMSALWPTPGDVPGLFLPLAVTSALLAAHASGTLTPGRAMRASLAQAAAFGLVLVAVAVVRELAGRVTQFVLEPPGVFILLGCGLALYNHFLRGRSRPRTAAEPSA
jgi:Na+-translocating ferredoxin:NAD+ oxidoreductase RnfE subunit